MSFVGIEKEQYEKIYDSINNINKTLNNKEYTDKYKLNLIKSVVEEMENNF